MKADETIWISATQLVGLPGMPGSVRAIQLRANKLGWHWRARKGRGGGREYPVDCLPLETRSAIVAARIKVTTIGVPPVALPPAATQAEQASRDGAAAGRRQLLAERMIDEAAAARRSASLCRVSSLSLRAQARIDAKLAVLRAWEAFQHETNATPTSSQHLFAEAYNAGRVDVPADVRQVIPAISAVSLSRWIKALRRDGISKLAGDYGNRDHQTLIGQQDDVRDFVVAMMASHPNCHPRHVMQGMKARFAGRTDVTLPTVRSVQRFMARWRAENAQLTTSISNPDGWRNRFMAAGGNASEGIVRLNQLWELDSTVGDVMLEDGRHAVLGCIDVYTRRAMLVVSKTSKATAIAALLRRCLLTWGVPETVKTDNGSDYTSRHVVRVLQGLEVRQDLCPPFSPWKKPHIERFFRSFSHDLVELLEGFVGHDVAQRKAIDESKSFAERLMKKGGVLPIRMTAQQFVAFCDRWIDDVYHQRGHSSLDGKSPAQVTAEWTLPPVVVPSDHALDMLLAEAPGGAGMRMVGKKGIQIDGNFYLSDEMGAHVGRWVQVRYDPFFDDAGIVSVLDEQGQFLFTAVCPELSGCSRADLAARMKARQREWLTAERAGLRAVVRRMKVEDIAAEILAERAAAAKVVVPLRIEGPALSTPALEAAGEAAADRLAIDVGPVVLRPLPMAGPKDKGAEGDEIDREQFEKLRSEIEAENRPPAEEENPGQIFARYLDLAEKGTEALTAAEVAWMRSYETTSQFRSMRANYEEFGEQALAVFGVRRKATGGGSPG